MDKRRVISISEGGCLMRIDQRALVYSASKGWMRLVEQPEEVQKQVMERASKVWSESTQQQVLLLSSRRKEVAQG